MKKSALLILLSILSVIIAPHVAHSQCTPGYSSAAYGCSYYGYGIGFFSTTSYTSAAIGDYASCTGSGYQNFYSTAGDSAVYQQNGVYTASISSYSSYPSENCQVWIDFNNNSTWETSERVGGLNGYSSSSSFSINIPYAAAVGYHRMRLVTSDVYSGSYPSMDPCASGYNYGEARDYRVRIVPLPPCSGSPTAGTAVSTTALACPSYSFTLSLSGMTASAGMTFQWYRCTTSGGSYTAITGATNPSYTTTETAAYYYHCTVTCTSSGGTSTSSNVFVDYISACYCSPSYTYASYACTSYYMDITDYTLNGYSSTSIHDVSSCDGSGYLDQTSLVCSLMQSITYVPSVTVGSYTMNTQTWIDFNNNGTFETSESVGGANSITYTAAYSLTVPITATPGLHRMRVEVSYYSGVPSYPGMDPCPTYNYGEVRDYSVNIVALPPCTGTPTPGHAISSTGMACPSTPFTLTDTGFSVSGSLAFQWYSSTDSSSWTPITGATNYTYTLTETDTMFYKCRVTCTSSGGYDSTAGIRVNYLPYCYCVPAFSSAGISCSSYGMSIGQFTVYGESGTNINDNVACDGSGYEDHTSMSVNFMQSVTYVATVWEPTTSSSYNKNIQTWIDFNNNGTFETSESVGYKNNWVTSGAYNVTMPITAAVGSHRMRIVVIYSGCCPGTSAPGIDPCPTTSTYTYGESRDYMVNIVALPPCTGTPAPGHAFASTGMACPSTPFTLTDTGFSVAGSLVFQWYSSTDSSTWVAISGATNNTYALTETDTMFYKCRVTCTASGGGYDSTNAIRVNYLPYCYCVPSFSSAGLACSSYGMSIGQYIVYGESGTNINDNVACDGTGYEDHTAMYVTFMQSVSYVATVYEPTTSSSYSKNIQTWIDFNDNGTFESSETVGYKNNWVTSGAYTLTMPLTATVGNHRMRDVVIYSGCCPGTSAPGISSCPTSSSGYSYGEVRDYTATIVALPPCSGTPTAGVVNTTSATACPSYSFTLSSTGYTVAGSLVFQWQKSSDSVTWTSISGATNTSYTLTESSSLYYRLYVVCTVSGASDTSAGLLIPYYSYCYCIPYYTNAALSCTSYNFAMASFHTGGEFGTYIMDDVPCDGSGYQNHTYMSTTYMQTRFYTDTIVSSTGTYAYTLSNQVWIDYNDNGTFESTETVTGMSAYAAMTATAYDTFTLSPATSTLGSHRMRVCHVYQPTGSSYPSINPCGATSYGEARDYTVNIVPLPPCAGTPTGGTAVASVGTACPSVAFTLSTVGSTLASGLTYQWYRSSTGATGSWSAISGATGSTCSTTETGPTYFCRVIVCTASSGVDTSAPVLVAYISYCYCSPSYAAAAAACGTYAMGTSKFRIVGVAGTMINDNTTCNGTTNYENLTGMSVSLLQGSTDTARIYNHASTGINMSVQSWIDYNNDGNFSSGESIGGGNSYHDSLTYSLTIPSTAAIGSHRMRTVTTYDGSGYTYPTLDPCTSGYSLGDARDYTVVIVTPGCTSTPTAGSVVTSATYGCTSFSPALTLSGSSTGSSITYQWEVSTTGSTWTAVAGATLDHYTPTVTSNVYYQCVLTCSFTGTSATATSVYLTVNPAPSTPSGASYVCSGASTSAFTSSPSGGTWSSGSPSIATANTTSGVVTGVATGVANITYTLASGCYSIATIYVNPSPFAITGYPTMCAGGTTTLADASTGGTWSSSNPSVATVSTSGVVTGITAGTVTISYTLSTGCASTASSATRTVTVNPNPSAILGSYSICLGSTSALTSATSGGVWTTSASSIASVSTTGVTSGLTVGTADITYTSPSSGCFTSATVTVNPIVTPTLSVSAAPGYTVCSGTSVTFTSSTTYPGTSPVFVWSVNGLIVGGAPSYTYTPANGDLISCWFQSSAGCATPDTMRASVSMTVHPSLAPSVSISTGVGDTLCLGSTATITATPVGGGTAPVYHWWVNGSTVGSTAGTYSYTPANGDVIVCRLYSNDICRLADSGSTTKTLTVFAIATPAVGLVSSLGPIVCDGSTVTYTATPTAGGTAPAYLWHVNSSVVGSSTPTYSYTPINGDTVSVMMTSNFPCITTAVANNSMVMTVEANVTPIGTVSVSPGYIVLPGSFATFTSTLTSGGGTYPTYQWTRNGANITGATNSTYTTNVLYTGDVICCVVTNNDPCSGSTTFNCINIIVGTNVGVTEVNPTVSDVTVLPNPNHGAFTIKGTLGISSDELVNMEITDMLGQVVFSSKATARAGQLNESVQLNGTIANGMYMLSVKSDHVSKVFHFVIEQ